MENAKKKFKATENQEDVVTVEGHVLEVIPIKISRNGKQYLNAVIQNSNEEFHTAVYFKTQLHAHFLQGKQLSNIRKTCK